MKHEIGVVLLGSDRGKLCRRDPQTYHPLISATLRIGWPQRHSRQGRIAMLP